MVERNSSRSSPRKLRCRWCGDDELYVRYHDDEWGRAVHDDRVFFEFMILESFQAGLSWLTILRKRENFRRAFAGFDPRKVAGFDGRAVRRLLGDAGIVRNRAKISAAIENAARFLAVQQEFGSFDAYVWRFTDGRVLRNTGGAARSTSPEAAALAKDLKRRGFRFMGPTVCYAYLQATGLVDDHSRDCFLFGRSSRDGRRRRPR